ncbi:LysR family transcriptional regulator [Arthrobacter sp. StoSoilB22]|uniref:LysR family transcriptional regulator n=1 Tax=Arthrobacter sp. StoSoilB22 TaxID=2830996 RepID=UPI001CC70B26|nr:LysR family transcriptional regulator [Arthrobacter sp. StoSoilB22]BCW62886.1 LysR family transcriptional regulator [Arthrobacter sp. StoSoilB22]
MELRHIRYFLAVSEEGSFLHAAQKLHISQPALSRQIADLERDIGQQLFERTPKGVSPTPAGEAMIVHGRQLLRLESTTREVVASSIRREQPVVVGVPPTVSERWFLDLISALRTAIPNVPLQIYEAFTADQLRVSRDGRIDLMLINQRPPDNLRRLKLSKVPRPFGIAVAPGHRLSAKKELVFSDLSGLRILAREQSQVPAAHDLAIREIEDSETVVLWSYGRFAEHARACAQAVCADAVFCGEAVARRQLPDWNWRPLTGLQSAITLWLAWQPDARDTVLAVASAISDINGRLR